MGFKDPRRWTKHPAERVHPVARAELVDRLLALNNDQVPFGVQVGEKPDLEAAWTKVPASVVASARLSPIRTDAGRGTRPAEAAT